MKEVTSFLGPLALLAVIVGAYWWSKSRSETMLQNWAEANGFQILEKRSRYLLTGPFKWWTASRNQTVYSFRARDRDGQERSGWARCGSYWGGIFFSNEIEVRWDQAVGCQRK